VQFGQRNLPPPLLHKLHDCTAAYFVREVTIFEEPAAPPSGYKIYEAMYFDGEVPSFWSNSLPPCSRQEKCDTVLFGR